ncbi:hypothetical protein LIA77_11934 [Sarocladium implicatum]|nr:hypothetical protein LIA77_11934 [Sarocladium implicatum]
MKYLSAIMLALATVAMAAPAPKVSDNGILGSTLGSITDNLSGNKDNGNGNGNGNEAGNGNGNGKEAGNGNKDNGSGNNIGNIGVSPSAPLLAIPSGAIVIAPDVDM